MARSHPGMPKPVPHVIAKSDLLKALLTVDADPAARERVLTMESEFRRRVGVHIESLTLEDAMFSKFNTNPFVLLFHSKNKGFKHISSIEQDILPAKVFSSMETSAGRMVEAVVLPVYGWTPVLSGMHSAGSVLDGRKLEGKLLRLATLKSGPRCLNDPTSENIADAIIAHCTGWAKEAGVRKLDFTYGVLYGTRKQSNKKDWHILRNIEDKLPAGSIKRPPAQSWHCEFKKDGVSVTVTIRIGTELWNHFAHEGTAFVEMVIALIRACISPSDTEPASYKFTIFDLRSIISLDVVPEDFNVSLLQRSQLEWFFFVARHFCDDLIDA
jgi:hypothetical protein